MKVTRYCLKFQLFTFEPFKARYVAQYLKCNDFRTDVAPVDNGFCQESTGICSKRCFNVKNQSLQHGALVKRQCIAHRCKVSIVDLTNICIVQNRQTNSFRRAHEATDGFTSVCGFHAFSGLALPLNHRRAMRGFLGVDCDDVCRHFVSFESCQYWQG